MKQELRPLLQKVAGEIVDDAVEVAGLVERFVEDIAGVAQQFVENQILQGVMSPYHRLPEEAEDVYLSCWELVVGMVVDEIVTLLLLAAGAIFLYTR
jgi:hypothetical protein